MLSIMFRVALCVGAPTDFGRSMALQSHVQWRSKATLAKIQIVCFPAKINSCNSLPTKIQIVRANLLPAGSKVQVLRAIRQ
jgi:hypothetical protein